MLAISYPIVDNGNGDLYVSDDPEYIAIFRAWLLTEVYPGEREFYPDFGSNVQLFSPNAESSLIEADNLQENLNSWCVTSDFDFSYQVIDDTILGIDFSIRILFNG